MDIVDKLLSLPADELKKRKKNRELRGSYRSHKRPVRTKQQLEEYLRKKGFKTRAQLRAGRDNEDPTDADYVKAYGSWTKAVDEIWNESACDRNLVVRLIIEFNLWSRRDYMSAYKERPDVLPSFYAVEKEFGSWVIAKEIAGAKSLKKILQSYIQLKNRLGKVPTNEDCRLAGITIDNAVKFYGGKRALDEFVKDLEEINDKR